MSMNNPFDYIPDDACNVAFRKLVARIEALKMSADPADVNFCRELEEGKMLGVLICSGNSCKCEDLKSLGISGDTRGQTEGSGDAEEMRVLYAFSGQLGDGGFFHEGFVGPVFDYLQPDGYFKTHENDISRQNEEIARFEDTVVKPLRDEYEVVKQRLEAEVEVYREKCRLSKLERHAKRNSEAARHVDHEDPDRREAEEDKSQSVSRIATTSQEDLEAMIRQSQFEKAELRRMKKRVAGELTPYAENLQKVRKQLDGMKEKRRADSEALQNWLFSNFKVLNACGESRSLSEIFADTPMGVAPSGAGECCAPKLLQAAYLQGLTPVAIAEYWYGKPKGGEVRLHGAYYPACRGKCLPVLSWMLQGLTIDPPLQSNLYSITGIDTVERRNSDTTSPESQSFTAFAPELVYENEWFCVVNKPSGMLSVPGKSRAMSVQEWLAERYGHDRFVKMVHRLDQDTSGLLIAALTPLSFKVLQALFARRRVTKTYVADLDGDFASRGLQRQGRIELPLSPDWLDRPRQRVDIENGKEAVTEYEFTGGAEGKSRVVFHPLTGRTHQLRVHSASGMGLGMPIVGDRLYGKNAPGSLTRLHLHAQKVEFKFPINGEYYSFESEVPF